MRKICILTGARSEYGHFKGVMREIKSHQNLELSVIAAGMHLSEEFGSTISEIAKDGFQISEKVEMNPEGDTGYSMAQSISKGIRGIADALQKIKPDIFLVIGDRIEALSGAIASAYMNIPIAHVHGGDTTKAGLDESARHAITKFAHIHFPGTMKSAERILKMGEDKWRIFNFGSPVIDAIVHAKLLSKDELINKFQINLKEPFIIMLQHAVTTQVEDSGKQAVETLDAIKSLGLQTIIIYPNSDAGGRKIIQEIKKYGSLPFIKTYKSLPHDHYLSLYKFASVLVGNSSSGIIESPSFKLPTVNIGIRQEGRERSTNIIDVPHDREKIINAIRKALYDKKFLKKVKSCKSPYGGGNSSEKIAGVLSKIKIDEKLLQKKIAY